MRVAVVGAGEVGRRVSRRLGAEDSVASLAVVDPDAFDVLDADVVVLCGPDEAQVDQAHEALARDCDVVALADSPASVTSMLALVDYAGELGRSVVVGAGASPGMSSLLAVHAAQVAGALDEVTIAIAGTGGPECVERRFRSLRVETQEWRDGEWVDCDARSGPELVWFPDPLGAVDCTRADVSDGLLLRRVLPDPPTISVKVQRDNPPPVPAGRLRRRRSPAPGGVRVAVSGRRFDGPATVVYAAVAPPAEIAASVASLVALELGARRERGEAPVVGGPAEVLDARAALARCASWGIALWVFEGLDADAGEGGSSGSGGDDR